MQESLKNNELVSALADGRLRGAEFARTVQWLSQTEDARLTWHAYHVAGDVLRSGETIVNARDAAFVQRLKLCLQQEAPLVPSAVATDLTDEKTILARIKGINRSEHGAANDTSFRWKLLGGVASLAAVSVISWQGLGGWGDQRGADQLAQVPVQTVKPEVAPQQTPAMPVGEPQRMIRDPQLDALLAAHRQFGGTSALQMPAGFLRNATFEGAAR